MAKKPKDRPQEEPQVSMFGALGQGALGEGALGESREVTREVKLISQRAVGTGSYEIQQTYRAGLYAEQAKIGFKDKTRQLLLEEGADLQEIDEKLSEYLPSFNYTELKVYSAIQRFIDEQYKPGEALEISFSPQEFFEYCGLRKNSRGTYSGKQKEEYLGALRDLSTKPKKLIQQQSEYVRGKKGKSKLKYFTYILTTPLLQLVEGDIIESDTLAEAKEVMAKAISGQELPKRKRTTRYLVKPDPIMYKLLDRLYVIKSISQFEEIKALHPGEKPKDSTQKFLDYIQMLDISPLPIGRDRLAERMGLDGYIRQRKKKEAYKRIKEALEDALTKKYILRYTEEPTGLLKIYLNPERCSRYAEKLERSKNTEEE